MTEERPQARSAATDLSDVLAKLRNFELSHHDHRNLHQILLDVQDTVMTICQSIQNLTYPIDDVTYVTAEIQAAVSYEKDRLKAKLAELQRKNKEKVEERAAFLEAQHKEYQSKLGHLNAIQKECGLYAKILTQKKAKVAGHHQQMQAETDEMGRQNQVLKRLRTKLEANKSKFSEDQSVLKSSSVELDKVISDRQTEIRQLHDRISTKSSVLEATKLANSLTAVELTKLRSRTEAVRAKADKKKQENLEIMSEFKTVRKMRKEEIGRTERRIVEQMVDYNNAKKVHTDIVDRIHSQFGNTKSLEETTVQASQKLKSLEAKSSQLIDTVDILCQTVQSFRNKVEQLELADQEFLRQQLDVNMTIAETVEGNQNHQSRFRQRSPRGFSTDTERSVTKEPIFLQPQVIPAKAEERQQKRQQLTPQNQAEAGRVAEAGQVAEEQLAEDGRVFRGAHSPISENSMSSYEGSLVTDLDEEIKFNARMTLFQEHFFTKNY